MKPSRLIENRMRVCPYSVTRVTEKIEITAPAARMVPQTVVPVMSLRIWARPASDASGGRRTPPTWPRDRRTQPARTGSIRSAARR